MAILQMALIIFPFRLGVLMMTWPSLFCPCYRWPLPFVSSLSADGPHRFFFRLGYSVADLVPPKDGIYSLTALFVFSFGRSADDRSSLSSGYISAGHGQLVLWPFRKWL